MLDPPLGRNKMNEMMTLITEAIHDQSFIRCIFSNPRKKDGYQKISIKPVLIKDTAFLQLSKTDGQKEFHENVSPLELHTNLTPYFEHFKQIQLFTEKADFQCLINKKGGQYVKKQPPTGKRPESLAHNRQKNYILDTSSSYGFLKALGLMDETGKIKPSKYDKYKQINRYLECVADCTDFLNKDMIRIIDFGCGKSYLTFALYHYLTEILHKKVEVIGLDLKADVIAFCNRLANTLGYTHLHFQVGDIGHYTTNQQIDMVVSLHACNTATDAALEKAIMWGAKVILAVPCCHHEAYTQIANADLAPILKHGILKERIAALVTDGLRAQLLESCGYDVSVMEFIDMAHTPKNILIRALLKKENALDPASYKAYEATCNALHLDLSLAHMLQKRDRL